MRHKPRADDFKRNPVEADRLITEWEQVKHKQNEAQGQADWWAGIESKLSGRASGASTAISNCATMKGYYQSVVAALNTTLDDIESDLSAYSSTGSY